MAHEILLVDDEEGIRKVVALNLREAGYTVRVAENAEQALGLFSEHAPAIVLSDIKMPGMDGIEMLKRIKQLSPDTEVIMITGHGDIDLAIASIKHDATDFVTKPINEDILDIALKRAEERIAMRRALKDHTDDLERLVEEKSRELIAAERFLAVGQAAASLSHAIKNIASGLEGSIFLLEKGQDEERREYLAQGFEMLKSNVDKIKTLSMDLLRLAAEPKPHYVECDPNQPAREAVELLTPRALELGVNLGLSAAPTLPLLRLDPEAVHRCLLNLIMNALDACAENPPEAPRRALVEVRRAKDRLLYRVIDSGPGVDPEVERCLFTAFVSSKGEKGAGIGLLSTKQLVNALGGQVTAERGPTRGAVFTINLPAGNCRE